MLDVIIGTLRRNVEIGIGGGGQLDFGTLLKYAALHLRAANGGVLRAHIDNTGSSRPNSSDLLPDPTTSRRQSVNSRSRRPTRPRGRRRGAHREGPEEALVAAAAKTPTIVLNGDGISGWPASPRTSSASAGYRMIVPPTGRRRTRRTSATSRRRSTTTPPGARAAATGLAALFHGAQVGPMPADIVPLSVHRDRRPGLPRDALSRAAPTIKHAPPRRAPRSPRRSRSLFAARKQLHFKLGCAVATGRELPARHLDVASRVYPLNKSPQGPAPRLQELAPRCRRLLGDRGGGRAGAREPELHAPDRGPSVRLLPHGLAHPHGRGTRPRDRALLARWNTLLDLISNETMVSVAKGLRAATEVGFRRDGAHHDRDLRDAALPELGDPPLVDVADDHAMTELGEARSSGKPDEAGPEDPDRDALRHGGSLPR